MSDYTTRQINFLPPLEVSKAKDFVDFLTKELHPCDIEYEIAENRLNENQGKAVEKHTTRATVEGKIALNRDRGTNGTPLHFEFLQNHLDANPSHFIGLRISDPETNKDRFSDLADEIESGVENYFTRSPSSLELFHQYLSA